MRKFGRVMSVFVGEAEYTGWGAAFDVRAGPSGPSSCDVSIDNPPDRLVKSLSSAETQIRVLAGYRDAGGAVEVAQGGIALDSVQQDRSGLEHRVSWSITSSRGTIRAPLLSEVLPAGSTSDDVFQALASAAGLAFDVYRPSEVVPYARGYALSGRIGPALDSVCRDSGSRWAIDDGRLRIWPIRGVARATAQVWSSATGLLGVSVSGGGDERITATALLSPAIRRGDTIRIEDRIHAGVVVVEEVQHTGALPSGAWDTTVVGRPV